MMIFNRRDLHEHMGTRAVAKLNTLNKYNLGEYKTVRVIEENNPAKNHRDVVRTALHYDTKECIKFFEKRIKDELTNPSARYKSYHCKCWNVVIELMRELEDKDERSKTENKLIARES